MVRRLKERRDERREERREFQDERRDVIRARGGLSFWSILTGVVVAFGSGILLTAIIAAILTALGVDDPNVTRGDIVQGGITGGIALVVAMFLAYLWGGYTAGRMARGKGALNGVLVPIVAIILAVIVGVIITALGAEIDLGQLNLPFNPQDLAESERVQTWGLGLGLAALVAMLLGGFLGGGLGSRWHTKLERREASTEDAGARGRVEGRREVEERRDAEARREAEERREAEARRDTGATEGSRSATTGDEYPPTPPRRDTSR